MSFADCIISEAAGHTDLGTNMPRDALKTSILRLMHTFTYHGVAESEDALVQLISREVIDAIDLGDDIRQRNLKRAITARLREFVSPHSTGFISKLQKPVPPAQVFSSEWLEHLRSRGILLDPKDELDWSGRGQHVEYDIKDEKDIPLKTERILGYSAAALVESVMCRRIRLARKTIRCSRRLCKEDAVTEVEHLQRLQHAHIVRVVGTYTLRKNLAILLYPAADWSLDDFMDDTIERCRNEHLHWSEPDGSPWGHQVQALGAFFGCLANTTQFLHSRNVKHMDIKPKNILVRYTPIGLGPLFYRVYLADFGITRAYQSAAEVETDSPTPFTRTYAAPEVVLQDKRGLSADIFSLGCVFMEMVATIVSFQGRNEREELRKARCNEHGDTSFHTNIGAICHWYQMVAPQGFPGLAYSLERYLNVNTFHTAFVDMLPRVIHYSANERPTAEEVAAQTAMSHCSRCFAGPEPFETARDISE